MFLRKSRLRLQLRLRQHYHGTVLSNLGVYSLLMYPNKCIHSFISDVFKEVNTTISIHALPGAESAGMVRAVPNLFLEPAQLRGRKCLVVPHAQGVEEPCPVLLHPNREQFNLTIVADPPRGRRCKGFFENACITPPANSYAYLVIRVDCTVAMCVIHTF